MQGGGVPKVEVISGTTDQDLLALYSDVMGELMVRSREEHRDHWGPEDDLPGPLVAVDDNVLSEVLRAVHDEMIVRQTERPGPWNLRDDESVQP